MSFVGYTCWQASDVQPILATEALEGDQAQFMATHTPIRNFEVEGTRPTLVEQKTEAGILYALTKSDLQHAFVVVEGEPGSGKSHLIRWLRVQWPGDSNDLVVLVRRIEGSLDGTLRRLKDSIGAEFAHLFDGLGQVQSTTLAGRARDFQYRLGNSLTGDYFDADAPIHAEWCAQWDVAKIITHHVAVERWKAPHRILEIISGKDGERNSELAQFSLADVAELGEMRNEIKEVGTKALMLLRKLGAEASVIRNAQREGRSFEEIADEVPESTRIVDALNKKRLNHAIQNLLGISSQGLKELFRRLREALKKQDRRLVLLLEDITSFQGVDDQLIDALIAQSTTDEDAKLCDLLSVVGITPAYYHKYLSTLGNVRGRITLHVRLGSNDSGSGFQRVSSLRTTEERQGFAATYLRAVRAGRDRLKKWFDDTKGQEAVPNRCTERCEFRDTCHATFGAVTVDGQDVGLYPFNSQALDHMYEVLEDPKGGMTLQTPRGMLQGVLSPPLMKPQAIPNQAFPSPEIEHSWLPQAERELLGMVQTIVRSRGGDATTQARLARLIAWWGQRDQATTFIRPDGQLEFAGVPKGVFEAFMVPWLGEGADEAQSLPDLELELTTNPDSGAESEREPTRGAEPAEPAAAGASEVQAQSTATVPEQRGPKAAKAAASLTKAPPGGPAKPTRPGTIADPELTLRRPQLQAWLKGGKLDQAEWWSARLFEAMKLLPWRRFGIDQWVQQKLFTEALVTLEGAVKATSMHFVVKRHEWVQAGLDSHLVLRARSFPAGEDEDFHHQNLARMLRKLGELVKEHVKRVMPPGPAALPWSPATSAAQVLLARGWLRGTIRPTASPAEQWDAVLAEETDPLANMDRRVDSWKETVQATQGSHDMVREMLKVMVNLTQDPWERKAGICDAGEVAAAVLALVTTLRPLTAPSEVKLPTQLAPVQRTAELVNEVGPRLHALPGREFERLLRQAEAIDEACRRQSLPAYLDRLDKVFTRLQQVWPAAPTTHLTEAAQARNALEKANLLKAEAGGALRAVDDFLANLSMEADEIRSHEGAALLAWVLDAPVKDLTLVREQVEVFERLLRQLDDDVQKYLANASGAAPMTCEDINAVGTRLKRDAEAVLAGL